MLTLAKSSLRQRFGSSVATFLNLFLGGAILVGFASLYTTGSAAGLSSADQGTLTTMSYVIGAWGLVIVVFGVSSALGLTVRQRSGEFALLKSVGATPRQISRLVRGETALLCLLAIVPAVAVGYLAGLAMVTALKSTHQIASNVHFQFGVYAIGSGLVDTFLAAFCASWYAARQATKLSAVAALTAARLEQPRLSRKRLIFGLVFLLIGADCGTLTLTVLKNQGFTTMAVAGEGCIQSAIGFALLAPTLMRATARILGPTLSAFGGVSGYLADKAVRQRTSQMAGLLMPIILFVSLATGALYIQIIMNDANSLKHVAQSADDKGVETLSFVVVGIIAVFAAVVVANIAIATTLARTREFGRQRLVGLTPKQVSRTVRLEAAVTIVAGIVFGTLSAAIGVVPFSIAETHRTLPHVSIAVYLGVVASALLITFAATAGSARRALRRPALDAAGKAE